jgi:flagellar protein FliS
MMTDALREYAETNVAGAGQLKLIIMLYEGANRFLNLARENIEQKNLVEAHQYLIKAKRIIVHFLCTTDPEGGELSMNLHNLYVFLYERIALANMRKSVEEIDVALRILNKLLDGWKELHQQSMPGVAERPGPGGGPSLSIRV